MHPVVSYRVQTQQHSISFIDEKETWVRGRHFGGRGDVTVSGQTASRGAATLSRSSLSGEMPCSLSQSRSTVRKMRVSPPPPVVSGITVHPGGACVSAQNTKEAQQTRPFPGFLQI